ncbi:LPS export ABC transporter periplasmic protein LptC [Aestuariivirga litoralis]|uniref:LPS export ABC transporter periplasmic protein LptC n=1 Tax=Aestuariivirga litoralis TaxID=2650924 RepID=UPI0018C54848|nr:LPS export ABC transporter periplasmic protein LptC [Aestuariivirga litoralis]MBG1232945.1 LPS export ABC transporter periplasmic protein LptC [Aestuariivirga litoralis]
MSSPTPDTFHSKAEQARARAARSRLVLRGSIVVGVLVVGAFVGQAIFMRAPTPPPAPVQEVEKAPVISGGFSTFTGIDQHSKPFSVKAQEGIQDAKSDSLMHLKTVTGSFLRHEGGEVQVTSNTADYELKTKDLHVAGDVRFEEPGRYVAYLKSAAVNLEKQRIVTKEPVQVQTAGATIFADSMETSEDGQVVKLTGNVKAHFADAGPSEE